MQPIIESPVGQPLMIHEVHGRGVERLDRGTRRTDDEVIDKKRPKRCHSER